MKEAQPAPPRHLAHGGGRRGDNHHLVRRDLRECAVFGRRDAMRDLPIGHTDLPACRNLPIGLETEPRGQEPPRLRHILVDDGPMVRGKAETPPARSRPFTPVGLKHRIFRKVPQEWRRRLAGHRDAPGLHRRPAGCWRGPDRLSWPRRPGSDN